MIRIRLHGRGGHGVKTAGRVVGTAAFLAGHEVQDCPVYGAERRGAAVASYVRISDRKILERGPIDSPDLILIGDETLLREAQSSVLQGKDAASGLFLNAPEDGSLPESLASDARVVRLDLTAKVLEKLGRASALSVALAAAAVKMSGCASRDELAEAVREELADIGASKADLEKNVELALDIFEALPTVPLAQRVLGGNVDLHAVGYEGAYAGAPSIAAPGNAVERQTGSWRLEKPEIDYEQCSACGLCFVQCPEGAVTLDQDGYPVIDYEHCKGCMICREICPIHAVHTGKEVRAW